jgi:hypothetical protein
MIAPEQRTAAIVPQRARNPKIVQFAADGVAADVRVEALDRRRRTSMYTIRLASTDADAFGRLVGVLASGDAVDLGSVVVARGSIGGGRLTVAPPPGGYEAVYLEIRSDQVLLQVEAPKPPRPRRIHPLAMASTLVASAAIAAGAGSLVTALPQPPILQTPDRAIAGSAVHVPYATRGYGSLAYTARFDDGVVFASGALEGKNGDIEIGLPPQSANRRVAIAVSLRGPLGAATGLTSFAVAPPPAPHVADVPARVLSFAARRDPSPYGETILASYLAVADRGTVMLEDRRGKIIASAPFSHVGTNRLTVAPAYRTQPLTARIVIDHGKSRAVASVVLAPQAAAGGDPSATRHAPRARAAMQPEAPLPPNAGMLAVEGRPVAGAPLAVRVMPHRSTMTVELQDASGTTLAEREIAPGTTHVAMPLPNDAAPYFLVLRYDRNGSEETVVRPIRAVARASP